MLNNSLARHNLWTPNKYSYAIKIQENYPCDYKMPDDVYKLLYIQQKALNVKLSEIKGAYNISQRD